MKKRILTFAALAAMATTLTACGGGSSRDTSALNTSYSLHYETLNYLKTQTASDGEVFANMVEGLVEADYQNRIVPLGAESWTSEIKEDGKQVWTFKLRQDIKWYDYEGNEYANVTANDYVAGIKYILNPRNGSETIGIVQMFIDGAKEYTDSLSNGSEADFSKVGIKAIDDYTLEYTLPYAMSYFPTALTYSCFLPVNEEFLKEQGDSFGNDAETILVNGPYFLTQDVKNSKMVLEKNDNYYNADIVALDKINYIFIPEDAGADWARLKFENGELDQVTITERDLGGYNKYVLGEDKSGSRENPYSPLVYPDVISDRFTFHYVFNFGRYYQENNSISYVKTGHKDEKSKENTAIALQNVNFRRGVFRGLDRTQFNQYYAPENPDQMTRNIFTPRELAADTNGKDYVDYYVEYFAQQKGSTADEMEKVLNDGNDYYYQPEEAKKFFEAAKSELGNTVTWPVTVDYLSQPNAEVYKYQKQMFDKFNSEFGDYVYIHMLDISGTEEFTNFGPSGSRNYDLVSTGWGPDYGDPLSYADTYTTNAGYLYVYNCLPAEGQIGTDKAVEVRDALFGEYTKLVKEANSFVNAEDSQKRMEAFAKAEYYLVEDQALILPGFTRSGGVQLYLSNIVPKTKSTALYGVSDRKWKWSRVHDGEMTKEIREGYLTSFENGEYDEMFYSANKSKLK